MIHDNFDGMASSGVEHFKNIFKAPVRASIAEVNRIAQLFPSFVEEEDNLSQME